MASVDIRELKAIVKHTGPLLPGKTTMLPATLSRHNNTLETELRIVFMHPRKMLSRWERWS